MQTNPFEPPSELADQGVQPVTSGDSRGLRMYVPNHVGLAAFLGSPIAGAWILGANYAALGRPAERTKALVVGVVATVALLALSLALPENMPNSILPIAYTFALREYAKRVQGKDIDRVLATGGTKYSGWRAAGIGLLCLVFIVVAAVVLFAVAGSPLTN